MTNYDDCASLKRHDEATVRCKTKDTAAIVREEWYTIGMDEQHSRLLMEVNALVAVVARLVGLASNWNGELSLVPGADFKGKKRFSCGIELHADLAEQEARWATLLHEVLHSISVGYVASSFWEFPGWEEGVIEQLQRYIRPLVLAELGISVEAEVFLISQNTHKYNTYIDALERLRLLIDAEPMAFYLGLIGTPIKLRPAFALGLGRTLTGSRKIEYIYAFSASDSILKSVLD